MIGRMTACSHVRVMLLFCNVVVVVGLRSRGMATSSFCATSVLEVMRGVDCCGDDVICCQFRPLFYELAILSSSL